MTRSQVSRAGVLISLASAAGCASNSWDCDCPDAKVDANAYAAQPAAAAEVPITTERFESGSLHWTDLSSPQIELFLADLNRRRDYDFSQHAGQAGPNNAYLTSWITQAVKQLISRGYTVDAIGDLHRPDQTMVATR